MHTLSQCKTGHEIMQLTNSFMKTTAHGCKLNLSEIENLTVTSVIEADGKAMISLANGADNICAIAVNIIDKCITLYPLES